MDQNLINQFIQNLTKDQIFPGLILKATCLRHLELTNKLHSNEDETDEYERLTEALNNANIIYGFDEYGCLELHSA